MKSLITSKRYKVVQYSVFCPTCGESVNSSRADELKYGKIIKCEKCETEFKVVNNEK